MTNLPTFRLTLWDCGLLLGYLILVISIGIRAARGQKTKVDYLLGDRQMPWFMVVAAVVTTGFTGISLMGAPGYSFAHDCRLFPGVLLGLLTVPITLPILSYLRREQFFTVYEFLERRFSFSLRAFASAFFLLTKFAYVGVVIYTPALLISTATGLPVYALTIAMGALALTLSLVGGLKGAVWADLLQLSIMLIGMGGILFTLLSANAASHGDILRTAIEAGKLRMWDFSFGWTEITLWALFFNTILSSVSMTFADQAEMQYYLSTKQGDVVKTYVASILIGIPMVGLLYFLGVLLYGFYAGGAHVLPDDIRAKSDSVLPFFVSTQLPAGLRGLVIAAMTAATVGTVVSVLNSLGQATVQDFMERLGKRSLSEDAKLRRSRVAVAFWGIAATLLACFVSRIGTIVETAQSLAGVAGGGLAGIFFLGFFTRRTGSVQAVVGCLCGTAASLIAMFLTEVNFLWYFVIGMGTTVVVAMLVSIGRPKSVQLSGIFTQLRAYSRKTFL